MFSQFQYPFILHKPKKHRCNFIPLNKTVKTCKKMCEFNQEYCEHHQKLMEKRLYPNMVPMEID